MTASGVTRRVPAEQVSVSDLVAADDRYRIRRDATWLFVDFREQRLPDQGWKFHVSSRPADFRDLLAVLVPFLLEHGCSFKLARSLRILGELNDGSSAPPSVGKAVTIYPDQDRVPRLGADLVSLLAGRRGPRILSDRRVSADAPVYYRYGPFRPNLVANQLGNLNSVMTGPDGDVVDGWATTTYRQPPWAVDPFATSTGTATTVDAAARRPALLGTHFELRRGLVEAARGNVYVAVDQRTGEEVVVKQGRAYVAESLDGHDARIQLRNERFVLSALHDVPDVARFRDHFRHGEDEYLVTSFDGPLTLADDIMRNGRYAPLEHPEPDAPPPELGESRSLDALAYRLCRTLRRIHERGFLLRDLSPKNLVLGATGDVVTFIDFGHCNHHDVTIRGGTKGYAPARQFDGAPAEARDDLHAMGMTLFAATIGAEPPVDADDLDATRELALRMLERIHGDRPPPVIAAVMDLLSADPVAMAEAFAVVADGRSPTAEPRPRRFAATVHRRGPDTDALTQRVLAQLVTRADQIVDDASEPDPGVYRGAAGVGLSLLSHLDGPRVAETVERLAAFSSRAAEQFRLRPGLYLGATGVELFLRRAAAAGVTADPLSPERLFGTAGEPFQGHDLMNGAAGIGLGHVLLNELNPGPEHADMIRRCAASLAAHDDGGDAFDSPDDDGVPGRDTSLGLSHGHAGVVEFHRQLHRTAPSPLTRDRLTASLAILSRRTRRFVAASGRSDAVGLCASWCRGMTGMGRVLFAAGRQLDDHALVETAIACAEACESWLPYLAEAGQCCGVAGIGEFFCDLAGYDRRFLAAAESAATQSLILRADAPPAPPARNQVQPGGASWATGATGVLVFLTRLRDVAPTDTVTGPL